MITLSANLRLLEGSQNAFSNILTDDNLKSNISANINAVINTQKQVRSPFILGASKFGENHTLENSLDYYMGSLLSDGNSTFIPKYQIDMTVQGISHFNIAFDTTHNKYPNYIVVNGTYIYDDDPIYTINVPQGSNNLTIEIDNWNSPFSPLVISGIYSTIDVKIDYNILKSLEIKHIDRANIDSPSYGIVSNSGSMTFIDSDTQIRDYVNLKLLNSNAKVKIILKDTIHNVEKQVGIYETTDWDYDTANKEVTLQFKDNLEELQSINHNGIPLERNANGIVVENKTARNMYAQLWQATPAKYGFLHYQDLDKYTRQRLYDYHIKRYYLESGTLWQQWNKLAELVQAHIWQEYDGRTIFKVVENGD